MQTPELRLDGVWKKFARGERHDSLRDMLPALARRLTGRQTPHEALADGDFWAVRDLSFRVGPGECLGIIGGNGAGKSTVLKLLTGILRPNRGCLEVRGRMGALIEVAAGFHPDLTGRENVFLQGAIMGMSQANIRRHFDEIVAFAGVDEFIDTPVKRYSSGMNARLGFAIAAHLDPDVLIVDEVLAVGDYGFQQRAFGRLQTLTQSGMPVVVVSHQLDRVMQLCTQAILLERGAEVTRGDPPDVVAAYFGGGGASSEGHRLEPHASYAIRSATASSTAVPSGGFVEIELRCARIEGTEHRSHESIGVALMSMAGAAHLAAFGTGHVGQLLPERGEFLVRIRVQLNVAPGPYTIETWVWAEHHATYRGPRLALDVRPGFEFDGLVQLNPSIAIEDLPRGPARALRSAPPVAAPVLPAPR
jgi:ABC-type polysaccharide/polyol phosphate transport system ATPase subunit